MAGDAVTHLSCAVVGYFAPLLNSLCPSRQTNPGNRTVPVIEKPALVRSALPVVRVVPQPRTAGPAQCEKSTATSAPLVVVHLPTVPTTLVAFVAAVGDAVAGRAIPATRAALAPTTRNVLRRIRQPFDRVSIASGCVRNANPRCLAGNGDGSRTGPTGSALRPADHDETLAWTIPGRPSGFATRGGSRLRVSAGFAPASPASELLSSGPEHLGAAWNVAQRRPSSPPACHARKVPGSP